MAQSKKAASKAIVLAQKREEPLFVNICTLTKPVYTAYLRGIEPKGKTALIVVFMAISVLVMGYGAAVGWRVDIIGFGLFGLIICGLAMGQPWMMAYSKTQTAQERYGGSQKNITRFYEDRMVMQNVSAHVEAEASYEDVTRLKETEDFFYLEVGKVYYFAIKTGFKGGEERIGAFRSFITGKAVNASGGFRD
ncbi:MAG: YcxB family protein [Eggerthellaceae bacterium]|nr:YcxB family protein [Eggerthellaceae bacterium]